MACGGGSGISEFFSDDPLVEAGVLELREEILLPEVEIDSSIGSYWGTEEEFNQFVQLQITAMALNTCADSGAIPITDDPSWSVPASVIEKIDIVRLARFQAAALAIKSLEIAIPPIAEIPDEDVIRAREELEEQLVPFRCSMLALAPTVRNGIESDSSLEEIYKEAGYVVETNVVPALQELQNRLLKEKRRFWRRLLLKGGVLAPKFAINWTTRGALFAALESLEDTKDIARVVIERGDLLTSLKSQGGLGYLLSVAEHPIFK